MDRSFADVGRQTLIAGAGSRPERIAAALRARIEGHDLGAGDRLPPEKELAAHFGVSRAAVREAIARLKVEGLVETRQGSGAFVLGPREIPLQADSLTRASVDSFLDLIHVRRAIEGEMAADAAVNHGRREMLAIDRALERLKVAEKAGRDGVKEDRDFHAAVAAATGNSYWMSLFETLTSHIEVGISVTRSNEAMRRDFAEQVAREHIEIRDGIAAHDPERARKAAIAHMEMAAKRTKSADRDFWQHGGASIVRLARAE